MKSIIFVVFILFNFAGYSQTYLDYYFKIQGVDGAIVIYDEKNESWIFNEENDIKRKTPIGFLFHLPTSLIGLELGIVKPYSTEFLPWDGVKKYYFGALFKNWNCNTTFDEALVYKTDWYYQHLSDQIKYRNYDFFLDDLDITNKNYDRKEKFYWHFGGLFSTPEKQLDFFRKLSKQELKFKKEHQKYVYEKLLLVKDVKYSIYGYETFDVYKGQRIDWWIGVLETKDNKYYFSTRVFEDVNKDQNQEFFNKKFQITLDIFRILGYI